MGDMKRKPNQSAVIGRELVTVAAAMLGMCSSAFSSDGGAPPQVAPLSNILPRSACSGAADPGFLRGWLQDPGFVCRPAVVTTIDRGLVAEEEV